jgi:uncharacterized membrane protein (UPF0127 family)
MSQVNRSFEVVERVGSRSVHAAARRLGLLFAIAAVLACRAPAVAAEADWSVAVFPSGASFALELAVDDEARARGYMFREKIGEQEGMLFVFDAPGHHPFWMKNCRAALDIIWLDDDFRVVEIAEDRPPCPAEGDCPSVHPQRAARFVLEVAAGTTRREGLQPGDRLVLLRRGER